MKKQKTVVGLLLVTLLAHTVWLQHRIVKISEVDSAQTREILTQGAAWRVILSSLDEESRAQFEGSLEGVLKEILK